MPEKRRPKKKEIPTFTSEEEEREFWLREDSADTIDWSKAERIKLSLTPPRPAPSETHRHRGS